MGSVDRPERRDSETADPGRDARLMRRALRLAEAGWGRVAPNPLVGAVVARGGEVVGEGHHPEFGGSHAEVVALEEAGERARGATLYVTLEPCSHRGKTPPCTDAVLEAGIARLVVACRDPHPVAGGGVDRLRRAGVEVTVGVEAEAARSLNAAFLWHQLTGSPFGALKLALSLDGRLARREGERTPVTGEAARAEVHRLRAGFDAVLVGRRTAAVDDPLLTVRGEPRPRRPPARVVLDSRLRLSPESRLARSAAEAPVWVVAAGGADPERRRALEAKGARVFEAPPSPGGVDPGAAFRVLAAEGVRSVLVEGGGRVAASFLRHDLLQRLYLFYAPVVFGTEGVPAFPGGASAGPGSWEPVVRRPLGPDTLLLLERTAATRRIAEAT